MESPKFIEIFGEMRGSTWNDGEIIIKDRTIRAKEPTIKCLGYTGALASKHFTDIYCDDLVDEENSKTETQRTKLKTWFYKVLDPTLNPDGDMNVVGTRYHPEDLYGELIRTIFTKQDSKGVVKKNYYVRIPALIKKKRIPPGAKEHEKFISFWPEKFSVKFLLKKKRDQGSIIFSGQMMNDVELMKGKIFKIDWFQFYKREDIKLKDLYIFQGVDLAINQKDSSDKFALTTIGIHPTTRNIYILDYFNQIIHYTLQKKKIAQEFDHYDPVRVGIEANGYQQAIIQDMQQSETLSHIRAVPIFTDTDKTLRAYKLSAYFERSQIFMLESMSGMMEHLLAMPDGRYKDLFDSLDIAVTVALGKDKGRKKEPGVI
jgi:phage terminase large subunit-like protein